MSDSVPIRTSGSVIAAQEEGIPRDAVSLSLNAVAKW